MRPGQRGLQLGDPGVPLGEFGTQAVEDVVDVVHAIATDGDRETHGVHIGAGHRAVLRQRVVQPVRLGIPQPTAVTTADDHERDRGHHHDHRDQQEPEHDQLPGLCACTDRAMRV